MKTKLITTALLFITLSSNAQAPLFSMEQKSGFAYNPALTGINNYGIINLQHQLRAGALSSSNSSSLIAFDAPINSIKSGLGIYTNMNHNNFYNLTNIGASYAFHGHINRKLKYSLGTSLENKQTATFTYDAINQDSSTVWRPDFIVNKSNHFNMSLGGVLYNENYILGLSASNMLINSIPTLYNLNFGIRINLSEYSHFTKETPINIIPTVLLSYQDNFLFWSTKINLNIKTFHLALGYQKEGASAYFGVDIKDFSLNFSHSIIRSKLTNSGYTQQGIAIHYKIKNKQRVSINRNPDYYNFDLF